VKRPRWPWLFAALAGALQPGCDSSGAQLPHACTLTAPSPPDWRLHADGTALRDGLGRVVFLRGVDAGGRSKFAPYVPFDYATGQYAQALSDYMDRAASWGIDAMRVPYTWAALEPTQGQDDADWLSRYQQLLDAAWARGIWTVVDFHQDVYSESFCGDGFPSWTIPNAPPPSHDCPGWAFEYFQDKGVQAAFDAFWASGSQVQAQYLAAWDRMIARFKDEAGVLGFEPINEPGWGSTSDIAGFEATTLTTFYSAVVPHMRAAAPLSLVFVDPSGFAGSVVSTGLQKPAGDGIVFAPHFYPIGSGDPDTVQTKMQPWADMGTQWNVPVFVGEFGTSHGNSIALDYMTAHFAALDALGMGGTLWEYSVESEEWNSETDSVVAADGTEYPVAQALVRPFARAVAGDGVAQSWDPASSVFTLSYAPSASAGTAITEVQLPARAFPDGFTVSLSSGCYDATSVPGRMLVQPDPGAAQVSLRVSP
jgi:endoglycosylceramidase